MQSGLSGIEFDYLPYAKKRLEAYLEKKAEILQHLNIPFNMLIK